MEKFWVRLLVPGVWPQLQAQGQPDAAPAQRVRQGPSVLLRVLSVQIQTETVAQAAPAHSPQGTPNVTGKCL